MRYTTFGRTGLSVSRLSMGCNRLGDPGVDPGPVAPDRQAGARPRRDLLRHLGELQPGPQRGRPRRGHQRPSTADRGRHQGGVPAETNDYPIRDFSAESILASGARPACERLRRDTHRPVHAPQPDRAQLETQTWAEAIEQLKAEGKVRYFGISTTTTPPASGRSSTGADFLQIEYDLLDPTAEDELLPLAQRAQHRHHGPDAAGAWPAERQVRRRPGDPAGAAVAPPDRRPPPASARAHRAASVPGSREGQTLAQAALRWLLQQPGVHCVIPGARTVEQLEDNIERRSTAT